MTELIIDNLDIFAHEQALIRNFTLTARAKEIIALQGNNGSGKSTLLKTLAGLYKVSSHKIFINGHDINGLSIEQRAHHIALLLQSAPIQPFCTAKRRIAHGLMPALGFEFFNDKSIDQTITDLCRRLRIEHLLHRCLENMSGGEQRLVHLARCLINQQQKIILLDEPSVYLDRSQRENIINILKDESNNNRLILFSTHDERLIERLATRIITIDETTRTASCMGMV